LKVEDIDYVQIYKNDTRIVKLNVRRYVMLSFAKCLHKNPTLRRIK